MLISTKGQYAMRIMIDLAINYTGNAVTVKANAGRQGISEKYLEQKYLHFQRPVTLKVQGEPGEATVL